MQNKQKQKTAFYEKNQQQQKTKTSLVDLHVMYAPRCTK